MTKKQTDLILCLVCSGWQESHILSLSKARLKLSTQSLSKYINLTVILQFFQYCKTSIYSNNHSQFIYGNQAMHINLFNILRMQNTFNTCQTKPTYCEMKQPIVFIITKSTISEIRVASARKKHRHCIKKKNGNV